MIARIDPDECIGCGICTGECPQDAIDIDSFAVVDPEFCVGCGACEEACPMGAITILDEDDD